MPRFSDDDFVDFCVREALVQRANIEQKEAAKEQERSNWRSKDARKAWAEEHGLI